MLRCLVAAHIDGRIAVDDRDLYSFERKQPSGQERLVARALSGGAGRVVAEEAHGGRFIALDNDAVYISRGMGAATSSAFRRRAARGSPSRRRALADRSSSSGTKSSTATWRSIA